MRVQFPKGQAMEGVNVADVPVSDEKTTTEVENKKEVEEKEEKKKDVEKAGNGVDQSEPHTPVSAVSAVHSTQPTTPSTTGERKENVPTKDEKKKEKEKEKEKGKENTSVKEEASIAAKPKAAAASRAPAAIPVVPVVPVPIPVQQKVLTPEKTAAATPAASDSTKKEEEANKQDALAAVEDAKTEAAPAGSAPASAPAPAPTPAAPKSWAELLRKDAPPASTAAGSGSVAGTVTPATTTTGVIGTSPAATAGPAKASSMRDVIASITGTEIAASKRLAFLEPRGLVNTGNMCYMNSVLQVLAFCPPFFTFLDRVGAQAVHNIGGEFPLIDAMIMFLKEFRILETGTTTEQLRAKLKTSQLEQYGDSFTPEYVYEVIRVLPRFRDMRQGHQQDAQEFLGFLLEELHEECALALKQAGAMQQNVAQQNGVEEDESPAQTQNDGWMEVGHKQRAAVTRSSGETSGETPITRIFGGKLRSEFRVPGNKISVTLEPYQSLQLDIGSPQVNTIVDALKNLTTPETMHGDFTTAKGTKSSATKQVFIESLPPVLILHLKRFQYDATTHGTQKIWKKIGYPLDLELPPEVLAPQRRNALSPPPRYRLIGVIYHHGKNASGGHYTVDVRRQDGREWIRIDDTVIRRVRPEDVAGGHISEEDSRALAAALEKQKASPAAAAAGLSARSNNIYDSIDGYDSDDNDDSEHGWKEVNNTSSSGGKKSMAAVASGSATPSAATTSGARYTPSSSVKDNRVAYLLIYDKVLGGAV